MKWCQGIYRGFIRPARSGFFSRVYYRDVKKNITLPKGPEKIAENSLGSGYQFRGAGEQRNLPKSGRLTKNRQISRGKSTENLRFKPKRGQENLPSCPLLCRFFRWAHPLSTVSAHIRVCIEISGLEFRKHKVGAAGRRINQIIFPRFSEPVGAQEGAVGA